MSSPLTPVVGSVEAEKDEICCTAAELPEPDEDWQTWEELVLRPRAGLTPEQHQAVQDEHGMQDGQLTLRVRRAMVDYTLAHLHLPMRSGHESGPILERVPEGRGSP